MKYILTFLYLCLCRDPVFSAATLTVTSTTSAVVAVTLTSIDVSVISVMDCRYQL